MKLEDVLSCIKAGISKEQKQNYMILDPEFLTVLAHWIKFDQKDQGWQEKILAGFGGSFPAMLIASEEKLMETMQISAKDVVTIKLFYEAALRLLKDRIYDCDIVQHKDYLTDYLIALIGRESIEYFIIYFLDRNNHVMKTEYQSKGTVNATSVYIREIAKNALECQADSLILVHNHPSGIALPSEADKQLTHVMLQALDAIDIEVMDHFIIGNGAYYSFAENGLLTSRNVKRTRRM